MKNDVEVQEKKARDKQSVTQKEKIFYLIDKFLKGKKLYLKDHSDKIPVNIEVQEDNTLKVFLPFNYQPGEKIFLYAIVEKYIELELNFIKTLAIGRHIYEPASANIAVNARRHQRFSIIDSSIVITQFQIFEELQSSRLDTHNLPISVKTIFADYERILQSFYPNASVGTFEINNLQNDKEINLVHSKKQILYLHDTQDQDSYFTENENMISYGILLGGNLTKQMHLLRQNKINSLLVYPILYRLTELKSIPFGYIKIWSENEPIDIVSSIPHLTYTSHEIIEKIRQTRTLRNLIQPQDAVDVGEGGLKLSVTNPELKEILPSHPEMIINVQLQVARQSIDFTLQGEVVASYLDKDNITRACIAFSRSTDSQLIRFRKGLEAWMIKQRDTTKQKKG